MAGRPRRLVVMVVLGVVWGTWTQSAARSDERLSTFGGAQIRQVADDRSEVFTFRVESRLQSRLTTIRILRPEPFDPGRKYPVVYLLPVEKEGDQRYGDSIAEVVQRGLHRAHQAIFVAPGFAELPWYADHPERSDLQQERFLLQVVLPFIEQHEPVIEGRAGRLLLGFSKSGWGAWSLLLRNPERFDRAIAWDAPLMMPNSGRYGSGPIFGTQANFESYRLMDLVSSARQTLGPQPRLMVSGAANFRGEHERMLQWAQQHEVPVKTINSAASRHDWHSGWVADSLTALLADSSSAPVSNGPAGESIVRTRDELVRAVREATPGTIVRVSPGEYAGDLTFEGLRGTEQQPIVITALDPQRRPVIRGRRFCLHFMRVAHVRIQDLELTGGSANGLNIDDGGSIDTPSHHVRLERLFVHDVGSGGNHDAIKLSGVDSFAVTDCVIERWGDSGSGIDMVGCHDGEITGCRLKFRGDNAASGLQMKGGSARIIVTRCDFDHAGGRAVNLGGSTGLPYFRPADAGYEARQLTVENCVFRGSMAPICFVGVDGATVRRNTIYQPQRWVFRILQESADERFVACRNGEVSGNVIAYESRQLRTPINVGGGTAPETFRFRNNAWYCLDRPGTSRRLSFAVPQAESHFGLDPGFVDAAGGDLNLRSESPLRNIGARR